MSFLRVIILPMLKRIYVFFVALVALIIFAPFIFFVSLIIALSIGKPVFYHQVRPGLNGKPFKMIKFRTMRETTGLDGKLLSDAERITPFGSFMRTTSLDELPELWNVLKGEMNLIGPRPLLMQYLPLYSKEQARRHHVKPGITGWAQINGRNAISWEEKFKLDVWYVENQSFWLDIKILFLTIKKVFSREGISHTGEVTMPVFKGTNADASAEVSQKII